MSSDQTHYAARRTHEMVLGFYRVRRALGVIALLLPIALVVGGMATEGQLRDSVSNYYYSQLREVFSGALFAIGVFLISYRGYARQPGETFSDRVLSFIAGVSALLVALFPALETCGPDALRCPSVESITQAATSFGVASWVHNIAAVVFFSCLVIFCLVQFPRTASRVRPVIYRLCGYGIIVTLLVITAAFAAGRWAGPSAEAMAARHNVIFWAEAVGIWIFALAWLTKGKADIAALSMARRIMAR